MKNKIVYAGIIAVMFIAAMIIFRDKMDIGEIIGAFIGASGTIIAVWNWIAKEEVKEDFKKVTNTPYKEWKDNAVALKKKR